jgi:excisionase family DNA binding protein
VIARRLLTAREVAENLALTPGTVLAWQRDGKLPAIKLPSGQIRFRPEEIEAWLSDHHVYSRGGSMDRQIRAHFEDGAYWATVDEHPGVFATGDTLEELGKSLQEGIALAGTEGGSAREDGFETALTPQSTKLSPKKGRAS